MGFKRVSKEELEQSKAPPFLGPPLQTTERLELLGKESLKSKKQFTHKESNIFLLAQENFKFEYTKNGALDNFEGIGDITIVNNSEKNRIWDVNLSYSGTENIFEYYTFINEDKKTNLGNFEPQTNKNLDYKIKDTKNIINPIKIFEKITVSNLNKENLGTKIKKRKIRKLEKEIQKKKEKTKVQIEEKYGKKIKSLQSEIKNKDNDIDKVLETLSKHTKKKNQLQKDINTLKKVINNLKKEKKEEKYEILERYLKKEDLNRNINELLEETKQKLESLKSKIPEIKKNYSNKQKMIKNEIEEKYNQKITQANKEVEKREDELARAYKKEEEWTKKEDRLENVVGKIEDRLKSLEDKFKIKKAETELKEKEGQYKKAEEKADKFADKVKSLKKSIKNLKKDIKSYKKNKNKELDSQLENLTDEEENKIEEYMDKIDKNKGLLKGIQNIIEKYEEDLKEYREKLKEHQVKLLDTGKEIENWMEKKEEIRLKINGLQDEVERLEKLKEKELKKEISRIKKKKEKREQRILDGYDDMIGEKLRDNYYLLFNTQNMLNYSINIENDSENKVKEVKLAKQFSDEFSDFKYESSSVSDVNINKNTIIFSIPSLDPGEKAEITIHTSIKPIERKIIGTGNIQLSYIYENRLISGLKFEELNGYSHAMHAMKIKEKETAPNKWTCQMIFKNNSDINMKLNSILVLDKEKRNKYLDLDFNSDKDGKLVKPQETFFSEKWEVEDKNEPKFYRKLNYSITHKTEKKSLMNLNLEESIFEIIDLSVEKKFTKSKIKSYEGSDLSCTLTLKNTGTIPIKGMVVKEIIPKDFLPPQDLSSFSIATSSGKDIADKVQIEILPDDQDASSSHEISIRVNLENIKPLELINVNENIKITYPFKAIKPDHTKEYNFPLNFTSYYPKEKKSPEDFYYISGTLPAQKLPNLDVIHQRRNLLIAKEIFPGRNVDEFAISLIVNNSSNIEITDIKIDDTLPNSIEVVSSNKEYNILDSDLERADTISFTIESILPFQEEEIRYYVRSKGDETLDQEKLESYLLT
ncbi:MAG: hypothetical protein EU541_00180 [Promethearchaeota archaeon]|nr:MAG: hypothetical protein EU541_00180 [Candidatus Lokiarchaeota archaeon]